MLRRLFSKDGRDYLLTFITEFTVLVAGVLVYKLAKEKLGDDGFSEYSIGRRTASFIQPLLILGLGVGIPRYVAFALHDERMKTKGSYFVSGSILVACVTIPVLAILIFFSSFFSGLFFGSPSYASLIPFICALILGMVIHSTVYGYFRGLSKMVQANLLQVFNLGLVPIAAFYSGKNIAEVLLITGGTWTISSLLVFFYLLATEKWAGSEIGVCIRELFNYGIQRVPGDVALAGFLALPAYFAAHVVDDNLKTAGYVAFGMSLLNMAGAAFGPICLILLPKASEVIVKKDFNLLGVYVTRITLLTLLLTAVGLLLAESFTAFFLDIYLGDPSPSLVFITRVILFGAAGFTLYISLRSILDAYYVKAVNTLNIFISFVFFLLASAVIRYTGVSWGLDGILYVFVMSMWILGALTYFTSAGIVRRKGNAGLN
ncbi:MAG TPA: hypothetical protein VI112_07575 [Bacteroidia bacterium]|jgi:O-antigen/teichoic acid export membrane protein